MRRCSVTVTIATQEDDGTITTLVDNRAAVDMVEVEKAEIETMSGEKVEYRVTMYNENEARLNDLARRCVEGALKSVVLP